MTREENLELLKQIEKDIYVCSLESTFLDDVKSCAIHSAIEELEHEPCEDCISREKAKQFLYERLDRLNDDELYDIFSRIIDDMYNELSSVEQEPKTEMLDKIRAEIAELHLIGYATVDGKREIASRAVLEILDKYKAESEG